MEIKELYKRIREFTIAATGYAGSKVVFANQLSNARPKKPFITIELKDFKNIGTPSVSTLHNTGQHDLTISMRATASFNSYADKVHAAEDALETLHIKLYSELSNDIFKGEIAARNALLKTTAIPKALNEQNESRSILEVEIGFNKTTSYTGSLIETVIVDSVVNDYNQELVIEK